MNLVIRGHPRERMRERKVTEADIENALSNFHTSMEDHPQDSIVYIGPGCDGRDLKVVLLRPGLQVPNSRLIVKTVAWR
ncbi:DUF4258 domain-containing protein [Nocardioides sp. TRM66260-LWL]|uniref:DUF4258 domain-containing protein n=1 Tax=Nocardioides sp. TRM66260-LWL TaxID=2874478 RepID=UPI001CC3FF72|nr:DUF4258 domain-containing protein [Nocardioides sp. TRM66260-LWL]MBZ5735636.1 DUF4258 domain-containing protein [Nocardioides sp. TRM66260-LWL]